MAVSILDLPQELLFLILKYVGAPFFRDDIRRITIYKRWSHVALTVFWADVKISNLGIKRLMRSPDSVRQLDLFKHHIKSLDIDVFKYGYKRPDTPFNANDEVVYGFRGRCDSSAVAAAIEGKTPLTSAGWEGRLEHDLARLLGYAREGRSLRSLRLITPNGSIPDAKRGFAVHRPILLSVFSLNRITFLELDTFETRFWADGGFHICPLIPPLFSQLRCLHLRMYNICSDALRPEDSDDNACLISLERVVLALVRSDRGPNIQYLKCCSPCDINGSQWFHHEAEIVEQARLLAARMANPKVFRVVTPGDVRERYSVYSLDILSNQRVGVEGDVEWDT